MTSREPNYRRPLSTEQLEILGLLYKFRFGSSDLVAEYFGKNHRMLAFNRLRILEEQGFVARRFDNTYRLQGKPAAYYLLPAGARALHTNGDLPSLSAIYKNKTVSDQFIAHCLDIFRLYLQLKSVYPDIKFFTKTDLNTEVYSYFPKPLPDAFISIKFAAKTPKRFFADIFDETVPAFVLKKRVQHYIAYEESGTWEDTGSDFPVVLFICETISQQGRLQKYLAKALDDSDEVIFATTTKAELTPLSQNTAVWQLATEPEEKCSLEAI